MDGLNENLLLAMLVGKDKLEKIMKLLKEMNGKYAAINQYMMDKDILEKTGNIAKFIILLRDYAEAVDRVGGDKEIPESIREMFTVERRLLPIIIMLSSLVWNEIEILKLQIAKKEGE